MCAGICHNFRVGIIAQNAAQDANHATRENAGDLFEALVGEHVGGIGAVGHRHAPVEVLAVQPVWIGGQVAGLARADRPLLTGARYWIPTQYDPDHVAQSINARQSIGHICVA